MRYPIIVLFLVVLVMRISQSAEGRDIPAEVKRVLLEQLDVDINEIMPSSKIRDDLGADDLGVVEVIMAMEENFEVDISDEDADKLITVNDYIQYITRIVNI